MPSLTSSPDDLITKILDNYEAEGNRAKTQLALLILANESYGVGYRDSSNGLPHAIASQDHKACGDILWMGNVKHVCTKPIDHSHHNYQPQGKPGNG